MKLYNPVKVKHANIFEYIVRGISGPIARMLAKTKVTPNQISVFRCVFMVIAFYLFAKSGTVNLILAALCILLWEVFDCVDGDLAFITHQRSEKGAWLENVTDSIFGLVPGFLGFFVTLGIYREMRNIYPWIVFSLLLIGYFLFKHFLHVDVPLVIGKTIKNEFQDKEKTRLGNIIHACYYWAELYFVFAAILYCPIKKYLGLNSLLIVMILMAIMYNCFWIGIIFMQYRRFRDR